MYRTISRPSLGLAVHNLWEESKSAALGAVSAHPMETQILVVMENVFLSSSQPTCFQATPSNHSPTNVVLLFGSSRDEFHNLCPG